jgi:DNA-binding NarL/FixJ family response regulator
MKESLRVLIAGANPAGEERVAAAFREVDEGPAFEVLRAPSLQEAARRAQGDEIDVVLYLLSGPDQGVLPLIELRAEAPDVPVVAVASADDEPLAIKAVQLGAADYLIAEKLYGTLVARCLRHAVEVERVRTQLRRREADWSPQWAPEGTGRAAALRTALPRFFAELVADYDRLLDQAVEQVLYRVEHPVEEGLQGLARRAGELKAGPRDIVDLHATAMKGKEQETGPQRMRLYVAEGRVRLLELMGHLVSYYRRLSLPRAYRLEGSGSGKGSDS